MACLVKDSMLSASLGALLAIGVSGPVLGQNPPDNPQPPSEIDQVMKATGYKYSDDGSFIDFKMTFNDTKRGHKVFVRKAPETYLSLKVNEVYGLVYESKEEPSKDIVTRIFEKRYRIGSIIIEKPSEKQAFWRIRYRLEFHSGWTADKFKDAANIVASTADSLEKELSSTGEDVL